MIQNKITTTKENSPCTPTTTLIKGSYEFMVKTPNKYMTDENEKPPSGSSSSSSKKNNKKNESKEDLVGRQTVLVVTQVHVTPVKRSTRNFPKTKKNAINNNNNNNKDGNVPASVEQVTKELQSLTIVEDSTNTKMTPLKTKRTQNKQSKTNSHKKHNDNTVDDDAVPTTTTSSTADWDIMNDTIDKDDKKGTEAHQTINDEDMVVVPYTLGRFWSWISGRYVCRSARLEHVAPVNYSS